MQISYSIIIPHHNAPALLNRCLASIPVRNDLQIIVVDDNSNEDLKPRIERTDVEILYIDALNTKGAGHARNVGMNHANGKWLLFADCDDYYENGILDVLDKYKDKDIDVLYFNYHQRDEVTGNILPEIQLQRYLNVYNGEEEQLAWIKYRNNTPWDKMIRRSLVEDRGMNFEEVVNGNDVLFSLFVAYYSKEVAIESRKLYSYMRNTNGLTGRRQSLHDVQCRVEHIIRHNAFNSYIGHPEWNSSSIKYVIENIRTDLSLLPLLPKTIKRLFFDRAFRNSWVELFKNKTIKNNDDNSSW